MEGHRKEKQRSLQRCKVAQVITIRQPCPKLPSHSDVADQSESELANHPTR